MRISIKEHKDKEINIKMHEGFNVVQLTMSTSMDKRESFTILKQSTRLEYQYCNDYEK